MASFLYTAKRSIKTGHTSGTDYTITIDLQQLDGNTPAPIKTVHKALGGEEVHQLHRIEKHFDLVTDYIAVDDSGTPDNDDMTEFLDSVAGGELFTFNDGSTAFTNARLVGNPTRARNGIFYSYTMKIRVA